MKLLRVHIESPYLLVRRFTRIVFGVTLLLVAIPTHVSPVLAADEPPVFLLNWGSKGTAAGQFDDPWGLAVDPDGNVWVADYQNSRVQKFNSKGEHLATWGSGGALGQFYYPIGVAADGDGNVYVTDRDNFRVQKYDADTGIWSGFASGFVLPAGIAMADNGRVFVIDYIDYPATFDQHVEVFDSSGAPLATFGGLGTGDGEFTNMSAIAVDSTGAVYIADSTITPDGPSRVQKFVWDPDAGISGEYVYVTQFSSKGYDDGQTFGVAGIVVDPVGGVYVTDYSNGRVQKFTYDSDSSSYVFALKWGTPGGLAGQFFKPTGIALHPNGDIYTTEWGTDRVQAFTYRKLSISLQAGWNMLSVPVVMDEPAVEDVFWDSVIIYTWDADAQAYTQVHAGGDLTDIEPGRAYWVKVTEENQGTLTFIGTFVDTPDDFEVALSSGWNMIGSVCRDIQLHGDNLSVVGDPDPDPLQRNAIYYWDADHTQYVLLGDTDPIVPGVGYWLASSTNCTMTMAPPA